MTTVVFQGPGESKEEAANGIEMYIIGSLIMEMEDGPSGRMEMPSLEELFNTKEFTGMIIYIVDVLHDFSLKDPIFELRNPAKSSCEEAKASKKNSKIWYIIINA